MKCHIKGVKLKLVSTAGAAGPRPVVCGLAPPSGALREGLGHRRVQGPVDTNPGLHAGGRTRLPTFCSLHGVLPVFEQEVPAYKQKK